MSFDKDTRNLLAKTVAACRRRLLEDVTDQLRGVFGLHPDGTVLPLEKLTHLSPDQHAAARRLRDLLDHYTAGAAGKDSDRRKAAYERMVLEISFTALNRLAALRLCEERGLVVECVRKGTTSAGFQMFERISGGALGGRYDTYRVFLECLFDEFALDLGVLFDRTTPQSAVFPSERCMEDVLAELNKPELTHLWTEDETIGWVYQYFNPPEERKAMRDASQAPRNSRELAVRNQFFTPRYVVEFLTDNTLGRIWYEMRKGDTVLKEECRYLVRRPNEVFLDPDEDVGSRQKAEGSEDLSQEELLKQPVYIEHRPKKDPRDIKVLDPACGSGHFLLYAFDLLEHIYEEAWEEQWAVCSRLYAEGVSDERKELSGSDCLAKSHGAGGDDLPGDKAIPKGGNLRINGANPQGVCIDTIEHSGGTRTDIEQRVSEFSVDSPRFREGSRNADSDCSEVAVSTGQRSAGGVGSDGGNREIDQRALELALKEIGYNYSNSAYRPLPTAYSSREAFLNAVPKMIIEHNLHGIDIDPRAVQIAALALWLRAQKTWKSLGLKAQERPRIARSNIVTAEPMPGEEDMRREFTAGLKPRVLGQIVDEVFEKMKLAGEAGPLLKIEEEIKDAVAAARKQWEESPKGEQLLLFPRSSAQSAPSRFDFSDLSPSLPTAYRLPPTDFWDQAEDRILDALKEYAERAENGHATRRRLFAEDAARGFAFINLCRNRYDVILMNPPFGASSQESKGYIDNHYPNTKGDLLTNFVERTLQLAEVQGCIGAISSRTPFFLSSFESFRRDVLGNIGVVQLFADLGEGVLDAMVETSIYVITKNISESNRSVFMRLLVETDKENELQMLSDECLSAGRSDKLFVAETKKFSLLRGAPFAYWISARTIKLLANTSPIEGNLAAIRVGLQTGDDRRFLRLIWEVPASKIGGAGIGSDTSRSSRDTTQFRNQFSKLGKRWAVFAKTDNASPWFSPLTLVLDWFRDGDLLKEYVRGRGYSPSKWIQSESLYFRPGFSYMLRSTRIVPFIVPFGVIPAAPVSEVFPFSGHEYSTLGICASNLGSAIARFKGGWFSRAVFQASLIQGLPVCKFSKMSLEHIKEIVDQNVNSRRSVVKRYEPFQEFTLPAWVHTSDKGGTTWDLYSLLGNKLEKEIANAYGFDEDQLDELERDIREAVSIRGKSQNKDAENSPDDSNEDEQELNIELISETLEEKAVGFVMYSFGVALGRWDIRIATDPSLAPKLPDPFDPLPICPPGMLVGPDGLPAEQNRIVSEEWLRARPDANTLPPEGSVKNPAIPDSEYPLRISWDGVLVDDPGFNGDRPHRDDIVRRVREVFDLLWKDKSHEIEQEACDILGVSDLRDYFRKPAGFFQDHLKRYSKSRRKAPIYWPLSTASGSYTIWLYYHRMNNQTLYGAVNKYVEPKIAEVQKEVDSMQYAVEAREKGISLSPPTAYSLLPTSELRKQWEEARAFLGELRDLREELLRIAALPYKPDLNDGVIINAAPFHGLFRLRSWAKDTEDCWKKLAKGDYDWAHSAYTIWPDRVREVCKRDRSIAIAHGLEDLCEVEAPESKKKSGRGRRKKKEP